MSTNHRIKATRLFRTWESMVARCHLPTHSGYYKYGGKGIVVCESWRNSWREFMAWALLHGYTDKLTIERVDFTKGYNPSNCTWIPLAAQAGNRGKSVLNTSGYVGVSWHSVKKKWVATVTVNKKRKEIGKFLTAEEGHEARKAYFVEHGLEEHLRIYELQHRDK